MINGEGGLNLRYRFSQNNLVKVAKMSFSYILQEQLMKLKWTKITFSEKIKQTVHKMSTIFKIFLN